MTGNRPIRIGVSSCLLGQRVRYDGDHKRASPLTGLLARHFEFVPLCPEVAIGLGVPRPPIRLAWSPASPRAVGVDDPTRDVTARLAAYGRRQARFHDDLCGYVFKARSPSCGVTRVPVYGRRRPGYGRGVYAAAFLMAHPLLPVAEEDGLAEPAQRENFIERVFAYHRWLAAEAEGLSAERLAVFHARHKLQLLAHGQERARALGRLAAGTGPIRSRAKKYVAEFMQALARPATRARHANALQHAAGHLTRRLSAPLRRELAALIHDYRRGGVPLAIPVTVMRRHFRRHPDPWIAAQVYLYPSRSEFVLRYGM